MKKRAAIGGTFNILHRGHRTIFEKGAEVADELVVGLVSDKMAHSTRKSVRSYLERKRDLEKYLNSIKRPYQIIEIDDSYGTADSMDDLTHIIVSESSQKNAQKINKERAKRDLQPLIIEVVPSVIGEDFVPISSSRIIKGEIDKEGRLLGPLRIRVGSANEVKIAAVEKVLRPLYGLIEIKGVDVPSGVPEQPKSEEVLQGAINRAKAAIGDAHLGIGIEAGLFWHDTIQSYFDVQFCAVVDSAGRVTVGHGPGFCYPPAVIDQIREGKSVNDAMQYLTGIKSIGRKTGSVGYLSKELINRTTLTEMAVITAFIPRMRPELYAKIWRNI
ncbi:MAG: inosine/xanthosine triphosphatase [Thermoplasmata archaeon]|nr:inosine/xanthosine triphosphatase [Thermoplasmata archaeon]